MPQSQAPSLGELSNINADPERGTGEPAVVFTGGQDMVRNLNENARFAAQQDRDNYKMFQNNLKEAYARGDAIANTDVAPQDKDAIQKRLADVLGKIAENPSFFKGGAEATKLTGELQKVQSDATRSKNDYVYDIAHRDFLERNPSMQTDENKSKISEFSSKPLGERKPFLLETAPIVDIGKLKDDLLADPTVKQTGVDVRPVGNNGEFNQEFETTTYKYQPFKQRWNLALDANPDIKRYAQNLYSKIPDAQKQGTTLEDFWSGLGDRAFGQNKDYVNETKGKLSKNDFALEDLKSADRLAQIKASTEPALIKAYAYNKKVNAELADAKDDKEKEAITYDEFMDNYQSQKQVVQGYTGGGLKVAELPAQESLPVYTFDGEKASLLKPFGATPEYISAPTEKNHNAKKFAGWQGGTYKQDFTKEGSEYQMKDIWDDYNKMVKTFGKDKVGDINTFIKKAVANGVYNLKLIGQNGSTDANINGAALRAISNKDTKKGQKGVFDVDAPEIIGSDGQSQGNVDVVTDDNNNQQNDNQ